MSQSKYKDYFQWRDDEKKALANPQPAPEKREFKTPDFLKTGVSKINAFRQSLSKITKPSFKNFNLSDKAAFNLAITTGVLVAGGIGYMMLFNTTSTLKKPKQKVVIDAHQKDSLLKRDAAITDSLYASVAADYAAKKIVLDSTYTQQFAFYKEGLSDTAMIPDMASYATGELLKKDTVLANAHKDFTFNIYRDSFVVEKTVKDYPVRRAEVLGLDKR